MGVAEAADESRFISMPTDLSEAPRRAEARERPRAAQARFTSRPIAVQTRNSPLIMAALPAPILRLAALPEMWTSPFVAARLPSPDQAHLFAASWSSPIVG